jgi:hypothetical protein
MEGLCDGGRHQILGGPESQLSNGFGARDAGLAATSA